MNFYFAPMEGLTGYIYRNAHNTLFHNIDKYFSPFIVARQSENFKTRELKDILPENNRDIVLVPQVLTNHAKDFIYTAKKIESLGYTEINLNLGCPSGTVVSKGRGAGFLAKKEELDAFLEEIFTESITKISVKTRIGKEQPEEFYELLDIFNKYPIEELIIHPRVQTDFYKNKPNMKVFKDALQLSKNPVCYNGDLFTAGDCKAFMEQFPQVDTMMIGRGLLANPGMIDELTNMPKCDKNLLKEFHDTIYEDYREALSGDVNILYKMKELWNYMIQAFTDSEKYEKKIRKAKKLTEYDSAVSNLFSEMKCW